MDELQTLRDRYDAMPAPEPETVAAARARLEVRMRRPERRRRALARRRLLVSVTAGLAAVAVVVVVVVTPRPSDTGAPAIGTSQLRPVSGAAALAGRAAAEAAARPGVELEPRQWVYLKSLVVVDGGEPEERELWRRADDKRFALMEDGKLRVFRGGEFEVPYPYLLALPRDPAELLARVYERVDEEAGRDRSSRRERALWSAERAGLSREEAERRADAAAPPLTAAERDLHAFQLIAQGMRDALLPARLRAAMYGALAEIPGVEYRERATDLAGRTGVALRLGRDRIVIDPESYDYLGYRASRQGDALIGAAPVDGPGRRP